MCPAQPRADTFIAAANFPCLRISPVANLLHHGKMRRIMMAQLARGLEEYGVATAYMYYVPDRLNARGRLTVSQG